MNDLDFRMIGGAALIIVGIGTFIFGGESRTGTWIEIFDFDFGFGKSREMGKYESKFWGVFYIALGLALLLYGENAPIQL